MSIEVLHCLCLNDSNKLLLGNVYSTLIGDARYSFVITSNSNLMASLTSDGPITMFLPFVEDGTSLSLDQVKVTFYNNSPL